MAPQNVQVTPLTASQLEVTWDPPPPESQNGNIQGYKASSRAWLGSFFQLTVPSAPEALAAPWLHAGLLCPQQHMPSMEAGPKCLEQAWGEGTASDIKAARRNPHRKWAAVCPTTKHQSMLHQGT